LTHIPPLEAEKEATQFLSSLRSRSPLPAQPELLEREPKLTHCASFPVIAIRQYSIQLSNVLAQLLVAKSKVLEAAASLGCCCYLNHGLQDWIPSERPASPVTCSDPWSSNPQANT
jgi:hypothetical protein